MSNQEELGVSFTAFVLSLATTAAVHFGDIADPSTGERMEPNLIGAGQMIEIIAKVSRGLGEPMKGQEIDKLDVKLAERGW